MRNKPKNTIVQNVANLLGMKVVDVKRVVDAFLDEVQFQIASGNRVHFNNLGIFETRKRKARVGRNPKTGETVHIPERVVATFKPTKELKDAVNKPMQD